ncbi:NUMOD4 motif [Mycobacteroides abscessus subsp. abscessus]|uniref:NUMOD4 motif-containing HNH endonuclease n=1 Tax=Mycobacteroides abscessus TaxID=36809 RepID=UPI0009271C38|nr:NUMOD4 motif [Mycobacteroides abscessus subsp. abscessus]
MNENWKPIPKWEGEYSVSDLGRIRSEAREVKRSDGKVQVVPERILKTPRDSKGYRHTNLYRNNKGTVCYVHRAVAEAFIGPLPVAQVCRHLNGNPLDNRAQNLCYGTDSDNKRDSVAHGTHANAKKTHCPRGHEYAGENVHLYQNRRYCRSCRRGGQK